MTRQREESEVNVEEVYGGVVAIARVLGFHISENKGGIYRVRRRRLLPAVLLSLGCTVYGSLLMLYLVLTPLPYWYMVINIPCVFGYCFLLVSYVGAVLKRDSMARYLTLMQSFTMRQSRWKINFSLLGYLGYTMILVTYTLLLLPSFEVAASIPFVCFTTFVPAILDLYMESFVVVLTASLEKLSKEVHTRKKWAIGDVRAAFSSWLEMVKAVAMHNKVFGLTTGLRVIQLMMKTLSLLYLACSLQQWRGGCLTLFFITTLPFMETTGLLYRVCLVGHHLAMAGERLLAAVTTATYQVPGGSREQMALSSLASRIEHHPSRLLVWGLDSLTLETFIQLERVVTACLIIVVQLGQDDHLAHAYIQGPLTRYDHCFAFSINTSTSTISTTAPTFTS